MLKSKIYTFGLLIGISIALFSCKGDAGAQGPTGAAGTASDVGVYTFGIKPANWVTNTNYPWEIDCSLTTGVINTDGAMECYYSTDSVNYTQLPWVTNGNSPFFEQSWVYNTAGSVSIRWYSIADNPSTGPTAPANAYFKVVSIPTAIIKQHPNTDWDVWSEVHALLAEQKANKN